MELTLTDPTGTVMKPATVQPDTASFAQMQDRMRSEATGETPPDAPAAPPRRTAEPTDEPTDEKPKRTRQTKADAARTTTAVTPAVPDTTDYTAGAQTLVANVWLGAAIVPLTQPYAAVLDANSDGLAAALAEGAKHNSTIKRWVSSSDNMWQLQLAGVVLSMGMQSIQLARDSELRGAAREMTRSKLMETLKAQGIEIPDAAAS